MHLSYPNVQLTGLLFYLLMYMADVYYSIIQYLVGRLMFRWLIIMKLSIFFIASCPTFHHFSLVNKIYKPVKLLQSFSYDHSELLASIFL